MNNFIGRYDLNVSWMAPGLVRGADSPDGYDVEDLVGLIAPRAVLPSVP